MARTSDVIRIEGLATATSPLVHGGEHEGGTTTVFRREKVVQPDGTVENIPIISGNSIRGQLRDECAEFCLQSAGIEFIEDVRVFHLLFSGGALTRGSDERFIDITLERRVRELLPVLSVFGGSVGNRVLGGRLLVDAWVPLCKEALPRLDERYYEEASKISMWDLMDRLSFTRRDDAKSRHIQDWLSPAARAIYDEKYEARMEADEAAERGMSQQMRYTYEALASGTRLQAGFTLLAVDEIEYGAFIAALALFAARPRIGGRSATGLGQVRLDLRQFRVAAPRVEEPLQRELAEKARSFLAGRDDDVRAMLQELAYAI